MPRILFGVSPVGLGHATRALVLATELGRHGAEVTIFSGGKAARFLAGKGFPVEDVVEEPYFRVAKGELTRVTLWYASSWLAHRKNLRQAERLVEMFKPDIVVGDEEFSGVSAARRSGVKRVLVADELALGFGRTWLSRKIEGRVEEWYRGLQESVDLLIVPEFGEDRGNTKYVGPMVRAASASCEEVRRRYFLPPGRVVLFSMSGSGVGKELAQSLVASKREWGEEASLVVAGNRGPKFTGDGVYDLGFVADNQNLVACADLVVSTAGKSTIDEAAASGTPMIAIPIRHHAEQERNAASLGYSFEDARRLPELVRSKIGRREAPRSFEGEREASRLILSLV